MVTPVSAELRTIKQGATVFIGESNLDITNALGSSTTIGWWAPTASISSSAPTKTINIAGRQTDFTVTPADFVGFTGNWYPLKSDGTVKIIAAFNVADPALAITVWDLQQLSEVTGKSVPQGEKLGFQIHTNMYAAVNPQYRPNVNPTTDGYININVKDKDGLVFTSLYNSVGTIIPLAYQFVNSQPYYWENSGSVGVNSVNNWYTDALDQNGRYRYSSGTYTVWAESALNKMKDNYKNAGSDYTGKTISATQTINLVSESVTIEANKDTIVRSKPFTVTITGSPNSQYHLWIKGISIMTGGFGNEAPMITPNQVGVVMDRPSDTSYPIGSYQYQNGAGKTIKNDVGTDPDKGTAYYCGIITSSSGKRTVEFSTSPNTKPQDYTFHVEGYMGQPPGQIKFDEVTVKVEKGAVTIVAAGDQRYSLGEEIQFSGTNTETYKTYLFIKGPNMQTVGSQIQSVNPRAIPVIDSNAATFKEVDVMDDKTWSWKWGTSNLAPDAGMYTIYAVSQPRDANNYVQASYGTVSIIITNTTGQTTDLMTAPTPVPSTQPQGFDSSVPSGIIIFLIIGLVLVGGGYVGYSRIIRSKGEKSSTPVITRQKETVTQPVSDTIQSRKEQTILNQINEIRNNPAVTSTTKSELNTIGDTIHEINLATSENPLKLFATKQLDSINNTLIRIHKKGVIFTRSPDSIRQMNDAEKYVEAIVESDKFLANLAQVEEIYDKATVYRTAMPDEDIISLYYAGKYASVIKVYELKLAKSDQTNKLGEKRWETLKRLNEEAEKIGAVPDSIKKNLLAQDIETLGRTINDLGSFIANAKPELTISLDCTQLSIERWHKLGITLTNTGLAHVENVAFAFSSEFETKGIKPISVKAGQSSYTDISIIPKNVGNILLDITLTYKDIQGREYRRVQEFWIDVIEKVTAAPLPSETPSSPVSQLIPKPLTPKQLPPDLSDKYTDSEFIGKGGFAHVFKAKRKDGKYVAVKIPISMDATTGRSFITEMQNWTKLSHPNIVGLYDFNILPMPYFEEELCDSALSDKNKPLESEEAALILFNICEGLKFAHTQKIIHRDLKPQNILLKNGVPKISDWGLSRIISSSTTTTATSFTAYYAAPEQIGNKIKDERTDIWQLGVIFYELVTGILPFTGDSMVEVMSGIATKNPTQPSVITPSLHDVEPIIMKCLEKNPDRRYQSVLELQKDLALYLRVTYTELLKTSVSVQDYSRSAYYCSDLVMVNLFTGDMKSAYKYLLDLVHYSKGDVKVEVQELSEQIKMRIEMGLTEIPDELIQKAELIVHQMSVGFRNKG